MKREQIVDKVRNSFRDSLRRSGTKEDKRFKKLKHNNDNYCIKQQSEKNIGELNSNREPDWATCSVDDSMNNLADSINNLAEFCCNQEEQTIVPIKQCMPIPKSLNPILLGAKSYHGALHTTKNNDSLSDTGLVRAIQLPHCELQVCQPKLPTTATSATSSIGGQQECSSSYVPNNESLEDLLFTIEVVLKSSDQPVVPTVNDSPAKCIEEFKLFCTNESNTV
jgi:hypothetical protein